MEWEQCGAVKTIHSLTAILDELQAELAISPGV